MRNESKIVGEGASSEHSEQKPVSPHQYDSLEELEALLKRLGLKKLVIYGQCNGEVDFDDLWWPLVEPLISSGTIHPTFTLIFDYPAAKGSETTEVYVFKSLLIVRQTWHPYPGYSWSETKVSLWMRR